MSESVLHHDHSDGGRQHTRRGRKPIMPDPNGGAAARFSCELLELKRSAGNPSYDRMRSELGAAASKSTLSAATRGRALPSWETTWEFVRSLAVTKLGGDADSVRREWRLRWEAANTELTSAPDSPAAPKPAVAVADEFAQLQSTGTPQPIVSRSHPVGTGEILDHGRRWGLVATVVAVIALVLAAVALPGLREQPAGEEKIVAAPKYPIPGDNSTFGGDGLPGDVTFPDGTQVHVGQTFEKIWRLKNAGVIPWVHRHLHVFGGTTVLCESPTDVPIPDTEPGQMVEVGVLVTPKGTGDCHVLWKMLDERDDLVFPDHNGIFYQVNVIP